MQPAQRGAQSLALVVSSLAGIDARLLQSLVTGAGHAGYVPAIFVREHLAYDSHRQGLSRVHGAVFENAQEAAEFAHQVPSVPVVSLEHDPLIAVDQVYADEYACGLEIAGRIAVTGKVRLAVVGELRRRDNESPLVRGYFDGALRHDLDLPYGRLRECGPRRRDAIACATELFRGSEPIPEVVLCSSDEIAIGVIDAASRLSLSVPHDVWVIGHGDSEFARLHEVTSSSVNHTQLAQQVIEQLILQPRERPPAARRAVAHRIQARATAPLPGQPGAIGTF